MPDNALDVAIQALKDELAVNTSLKASILAYVQSVPTLIQAAVDKALAAGATPEELQALTDLRTALAANDTDIAAAITAATAAVNTP